MTSDPHLRLNLLALENFTVEQKQKYVQVCIAVEKIANSPDFKRY